MTTADPIRIRDLIRLLDDVCTGYSELVDVVQRKIDAIKRSDLAGMREATDQEQSLTGQLQSKEALRRQLMDLIGEQMGLTKGTGRVMTSSQLAPLIEAPQRSLFEAATGNLNKTLVVLAQINQVASFIAREVMGHLQAVFSSVSNGNRQPAGYSGLGRAVSGEQTQILEAIG